jgi:hemerythrin
MINLNWSEDYRVGIPAIDNENKILVSMINDMSQVIDTHKDFQFQIICESLENLSHCIRSHIESEERFLMFNNYPEYDAHKAEHTNMLEQLQDFEMRCKTENIHFTEKTLLFLIDLLVRHIILYDCKFGHYFRDKELAGHGE